MTTSQWVLVLLSGVTLSNARAVMAQTTIRDPGGFTFTVPAGYLQYPAEEPGYYTFVRPGVRPSHDDIQVITVTPNAHTVAGTEPLSESERADFERWLDVDRFEYQRIRWRHFELDLISTYATELGIPSATVMVQLPLTTSFVVTVSGPASEIEALRQDMRATITSMHGPAALRHPMASFFREIASSLLGVTLLGTVVVAFLRRQRR